MPVANEQDHYFEVNPDRPSTDLPVVVLKAKSDRRVRQGHRWVYSNEIDIERSVFKSMSPGQQATLVSAQGVELGSGYFNPHALLCGRLYSTAHNQPLDQTTIAQRLKLALQWRESCYREPCYRLVYGDGDALPGLVVDRYGDTLVMQITTTGMMQALDSVVAALVEVVAPKGILLRNESANEIERLDARVETVFGEVPDSVNIIENAFEFTIPVHNGQKTGWFYDHRDSRALMAKYAQGKTVLDVYSYIGGWGLQAMAGGAASVSCIDSSSFALQSAEQMAQHAGFNDNMTFIKGSAIDELKRLASGGKCFDIIVLDPPAFIKRRKDKRAGEKAYHHINQLAIKLLNPNGLLVSASCSLHLAREELTRVVQTAAARAGRSASIVHQGSLGADHPVTIAMPEMDYLKAVFARVE